MKVRGIEQDDDVFFSYDFDGDDGDEVDNVLKESNMVLYDEYDEEEDQGQEEVVMKDGFVDYISFDIYIFYQRIIFFDYKFIILIFIFDYDVVVFELKVKVYVEVVRELDCVENEGCLGIIIINEGVLLQDQVVVEFGDVEFLDMKQCFFIIVNIGSVFVIFLFVEKLGFVELEDVSLIWLFILFMQVDGVILDFMGKIVML